MTSRRRLGILTNLRFSTSTHSDSSRPNSEKLDCPDVFKAPHFARCWVRYATGWPNSAHATCLRSRVSVSDETTNGHIQTRLGLRTGTDVRVRVIWCYSKWLE